MCCILEVVTYGKTYKGWNFWVGMESGSNRNMVLLGYIVKKALTLQKEMPSVAHDWTVEDIFQKDIAERRCLVSFLGIEGKDPENTATSVVRVALYGVDEIGHIKGFPGLVDRDLYVKVARRHRLMMLNERNRGPDGFSNIDKGVLGEISHKGVLARGRIPIGDEEMEFAYECAMSPEYAGRGGVGWAKVSDELNGQFGNGRTKSSVKGMVDAYKKKIS